MKKPFTKIPNEAEELRNVGQSVKLRLWHDIFREIYSYNPLTINPTGLDQ